MHIDEPLWPVPTQATWDFAEAYAPESDSIVEARQRAAELGVTSVSAGAGATLRLLTAASRSRSVVEVGTGTGVTALWLLQGLPADGQLTSIDVEGEHHRIAREMLASADVPQGRVRLIPGHPGEILPRLQDAAYDLVLLNVEATALDAILEQALRLLRPGGLLVVSNAFAGNRLGDPAQRDASTVARRLFAHRIAEDERLLPALVSAGDGLLAAVYQPA